ncbi:MAG: DUF6427 family protein [Bacteroidales bacterium]
MLFVWMSAFIHPGSPSSFDFDSRPMPLFGSLITIAGSSPFAGVLLSFVLVLLMSFLLVNFNTSVFFISERTFLPSLLYILFSGAFPAQQILNPALPAAIFLILAIGRIMDSYKVQGTAYSFFDAALLISAGSLFYASLIWFGFLLFVGIGLLRPVNMREIIISIIGLITPWFITFGLFYVTGKDMSYWISTVSFNLFEKVTTFTFNPLSIAVLCIGGLLFLASLLQLFYAINSKKIKSRKTFILLVWTFIVSVGVYLLSRAVAMEIFWLAAIPVSYVITHYFVFARRRILPEVLFAAFFVAVIVVQIVRLAQ